MEPPTARTLDRACPVRLCLISSRSCIPFSKQTLPANTQNTQFEFALIFSVPGTTICLSSFTLSNLLSRLCKNNSKRNSDSNSQLNSKRVMFFHSRIIIHNPKKMPTHSKQRNRIERPYTHFVVGIDTEHAFSRSCSKSSRKYSGGQCTPHTKPRFIYSIIITKED